MSVKTHDYEKQAGAFAELEMQGTQYLAFRDIPTLIAKYAGAVESVLDYGCGAGRSTRFLKRLGYDAIGVDISQDMLEQARSKDEVGQYLHIPSGRLPFDAAAFDLIFASYVFLEVSRIEEIERILTELKRVLKKHGIIILVTSSTEATEGSWVSLSYAFPENEKALQSGDTVKLLIEGVDVVLYDYFWTEEDYVRAAEDAGLALAKLHKPLGLPDEGIEWRDETKMSPIAIYVLRNRA
ncbi:class I SAM-dependent methyltransferase [Frigidibacter sp. RF13]|uniref:class I SAM-dependent methyltransferase n=1 Tax=Frigidibacter sp. RF13 TaxID=2997340 RepID=UPI00226E6DDA|nr:class I SAM-dependent methyltransferase [Frigidibacter sp. RF13]MCY1127250.1 class I SAM-dependent methyltransferase [Frigidibacter sp. RF13]